MLPAEIPNIDPDRQKPEGMYVCYVEGNDTNRFADKILLMWINRKWGYTSSGERFRGHVYACYGPLPGLKIEDHTE